MADTSPPAETETEQPADDGGENEAQAVALLEVNRIKCHSIAGVEEEHVDGPPLTATA